MKLVEGENAKRCSNCNKLKPFQAFYKDKRYNNNRTGVCKVCQSEKSKQYYYDNYEERKKWRENNKDLIKDYHHKQRVKKLTKESIQRNYKKFRDWLQEERDCSRCGKRKPFNDFYAQKKGRYGIKSHCKRCHIVNQKNYKSVNNNNDKEIPKNRDKVKRQVQKVMDNRYS